MIVKLVFTAFEFDDKHERDSVKNKLARLLVVPLGNALRRTPHFGVVDRRLATLKQVCYNALIAFS